MKAVFVDIVRLSVWLALLAAIFIPIERMFAARRSPVVRPQIGVDLVWYFINAIVPAAVLALPAAALAQLLQGADPLGLYTTVAALPLWERLLGAFLINDFGGYWVHRWQHHNAWAWRFHAVHHSAEHIDWLVNSRAHPIDMVIGRLGGLVLIYLLGFAQVEGAGFDPVVAWVAIGSTVWSFLLHANVRWRFGPLEWLVALPAFHHWHHSNDANRDRNFAAVFPFYDRLFGTLYLPPTLPTVYGIDGHVAASLTGQLLDPLRGPVRPKPGPAGNGTGSLAPAAPHALGDA